MNVEVLEVVQAAGPEKRDQTPGGFVSVIVPVTERPDPLDDLYAEYAAPLLAAGRPFEFVFVLQPWFRELAPLLVALRERGKPVRVLEAAQVLGEAALVKLGAEHARGDIVVTLPAYRRVHATALLELIARVEGGADLAVARRWPRRDSWINRLQNRAFHVLLGGLARDRLHDVACGVRAMRRGLLDELPLYGDVHRYLPLLALRDGHRVEEVPAPQHPRDLAPRVYSLGVYVRRVIDVLGLFFLLRFTEKPLRFFGLIGATSGFLGAVILGILAIQRLGGRGIADRPLLLLGVLLVVLGIQAVALGLIGEIIVHLSASRRRPYRLARSQSSELK